MTPDERSRAAEAGTGHQRAIQVNGEALNVDVGTTIAGVVESLGRDPREVAVELNGVIVPRDRYAFVSLQEGDKVEVVQFVQGG
jgi:thiamine biosynthesis protein ThiS